MRSGGTGEPPQGEVRKCEAASVSEGERRCNCGSIPEGWEVCRLKNYLLRIRPLIDAYTIHSTGITLSRLRLYPDSFLSLYFIVPPITEQKEIADFLDTKCTEIDKLIAKKEQLVKELENYKKSLIYEVVTGKREV